MDIQRAKLRATGISERVDGVFVSEEADARKPQARHFALVAASCGTVLGDGGWMVGAATRSTTSAVDAQRGCTPSGSATAAPGHRTILGRTTWYRMHRAAVDLLLLHSADPVRTTT
ncbi:hypothetical protein [Streptomyces sp. NPDC059970]|uniref:hypothetical protein n=1 Tax=Streptomyces sp. NPDC059970 TaxID=3347019 RepID=UPI0036CCDF00